MKQMCEGVSVEEKKKLLWNDVCEIVKHQCRVCASWHWMDCVNVAATA